MGKFTQDILIPGYSRNNTEVPEVFAYRTITFYGRLFQGRSANFGICNFFKNLNLNRWWPRFKFLVYYPYYPAYFLRNKRFRLVPFRSPLLRGSVRFLFLWVLKCFTSPGLLPSPLLATFCEILTKYVLIWYTYYSTITPLQLGLTEQQVVNLWGVFYFSLPKVVRDHCGSHNGVAPFGHRRIAGC